MEKIELNPLNLQRVQSLIKNKLKMNVLIVDDSAFNILVLKS